VIDDEDVFALSSRFGLMDATSECRCSKLASALQFRCPLLQGGAMSGSTAPIGAEPQVYPIRPFKLNVPQAALDDLKSRLAQTRWPDELPGTGADYGASLRFVMDTARYWGTIFNWRVQEARINAVPQFTTFIDGQTIHFFHVRSPERHALPIILTHGWPSTSAEFLDLIGPLTDPRRHGADPADAFDLVIPSVPGFGLSGPTRDTGWNSVRIAKAWGELMRRLGYERYGSHGGDLGALVSHELAILEPPGLVGVHVLEIYAYPSGDPAELEGLSDFDREGLAMLKTFQSKAGYQGIQSTRPQTLAYGLTDSPAGQLAWSSELFTGFGGVFGKPDALNRDLFLTHVTLYWLTRTAAASSRVYFEDAKGGTGSRQVPNATPTGVAVFPNNFRSIRRLAEKTNKIVHWSQFDRGGHFAAMDAPDLLIDDLRVFFRRFRDRA
jgi:pimeloyl-ACP methyl ester carboxylesterase